MAQPSPASPSDLSDASAGEVEYLLSLAERLNTSYQWAKLGAYALVVIAALMLLIVAADLYDQVSLARQPFPNAASMALLGALATVPIIAGYAGSLLYKRSLHDRVTLYEIVRTLHEVLPAASQHWSQLHEFSFKIRLSRLGIEPDNSLPRRGSAVSRATGV